MLKTKRHDASLNLYLDKSHGRAKYILRGLFGETVDLDADNKELESNNDKVIELQTILLTSVLEDQNTPSVIDYLSIHVEGVEERVLSGLNFDKYTFRVIAIERPVESLQELLKDHGYILIKEIPGLDCFYIHHTFLSEYVNNIFEFYNNI